MIVHGNAKLGPAVRLRKFAGHAGVHCTRKRNRGPPARHGCCWDPRSSVLWRCTAAYPGRVLAASALSLKRLYSG
jgi:hypothetical protein